MGTKRFLKTFNSSNSFHLNYTYYFPAWSENTDAIIIISNIVVCVISIVVVFILVIVVFILVFVVFILVPFSVVILFITQVRDLKGKEYVNT